MLDGVDGGILDEYLEVEVAEGVRSGDIQVGRHRAQLTLPYVVRARVGVGHGEVSVDVNVRIGADQFTRGVEVHLIQVCALNRGAEGS